MSHLDVPTVRAAVHLSELSAEPDLLLEAVWQCLAPRPRAPAIGGQARAQATDLLRAQPNKARFRTGQGVASGGVRPRWLHLPGLWACRRTVKRGSHSALFAVPRATLRVVKRADTLRRLPQENTHLWLAWLLAQTTTTAGGLAFVPHVVQQPRQGCVFPRRLCGHHADRATGTERRVGRAPTADPKVGLLG